MSNGESAFPVFAGSEAGMTLRDYFAARAMEAWLPIMIQAITAQTSPKARAAAAAEMSKDIADAAYVQADAMLKTRAE